MTSKEIIKAVIEHNHPPRIGHAFSKKSNDFVYIGGAARFIRPDGGRTHLRAWGKHEELLEKVPHFRGEVFEDAYGNIYGRFEGKTKGECIRGVIQDGWEHFDRFKIPEIDPKYYGELKEKKLAEHEKFIVSPFPLSVFSVLRDARLMDNALMDTAMEPENVAMFLDKICGRSLEIIEGLGGTGCDAVIMYDDWGTQDRTFISPDSFRELFKPAYKKIAAALHRNGLKFILHSCGYIYDFIGDLIDAGIDIFQFDQIAVYDIGDLAKRFGGRAAFFSPVDIQKILPTGDRAFIERSALELVDTFKSVCGGSLIVKDYAPYSDVNVQEEWADWARDVVLANSEIKG